MPKRSFFVQESQMDNYQYIIINSTASSLVVKGCAGSGKSILALWKAKQIQDNNRGSFLFIVKMNSLKQYMHDGISQIGIDETNVETFNKCFYFSKQDGEFIRGNWKKGHFDYILVDEAQDLSIEDIQLLRSKANNVFFYGDSAQQLLPNGARMETIADRLEIPLRELTFNYRLPKKVARVAAIINSENDELETRCVNEGVEKPFVFKCNSFEDELDTIMTIINNRKFEDVGIFYRNDKDVERAYNYFRNHNFNVEARFFGGGVDTLNFNSTNPKILNYYNSKGLQFEAVFIPNFSDLDQKFSTNARNALYVAITRTYQSLYILHSGNLSSFFDDVPTNLYETPQSQTELL
ncbi:MAG: ATP-binding domain-containing protein [Bacteroidales bacterium]|nr:ATP-binding domain-containing protein [Bacteroidales bacterium]